MKISNPVLTGFHADPSMIRVGDTYYIANSTFEWFPGVRLHESKDLVHWNILPSPLSRSSQLDMRGNPSSGGIWAPDLSYADNKFWLIYTDVKVVNGAFKDCTNYLVTAEDIHGPWSEPVRINGVGFDARNGPHHLGWHLGEDHRRSPPIQEGWLVLPVCRRRRHGV